MGAEKGVDRDPTPLAMPLGIRRNARVALGGASLAHVSLGLRLFPIRLRCGVFCGACVIITLVSIHSG